MTQVLLVLYMFKFKFNCRFTVSQLIINKNFYFSVIKFLDTLFKEIYSWKIILFNWIYYKYIFEEHFCKRIYLNYESTKYY
jgi:hypothetical protein